MGDGQPERAADMTMTELIERLTGQTSQLVRQEATLAREELLTKASKAGMGTMLFGSAGALAVYGAGVVVAGMIAAVAIELPPWAAALIIAGWLLAASGALVLMGRRQLRRGLPLFPTEAAGRVKADAKAIVERARK
jgi:hypothetical protein